MVNFADTDIEPSSNKPKVLETSFVNINCPSATVSTGSMDEDSQLQLVEENERLKAELEQLRIQLTALRGGGGIGRTTVAKRAPQSGPQGKRLFREWENTLRSSLSASEERFSKPDHGGKLVLELPQTSRKSRRQKSTSKRQDEGNSSGTDEDRETVERYIDLEAHESLRGLHHRQNLNIAPPASILIARPPFRAPKLRATSLTHKHSSVKVEVDEKFVQEGALLDKYSDDHRPHGLDDVACQSLLEESIYGCVKERAGWLVGLLILQSMSSFILAQNEALLEEHMVIIRFLTMLVGAGGNAGNQASVRGASI